MKMKLECLALFAVFCLPLCAQHVYDMARFGIQPGKKSNMSTRMEKALAKIRKEVKEGKAVTLRFQSGTYHSILKELQNVLTTSPTTTRIILKEWDWHWRI